MVLVPRLRGSQVRHLGRHTTRSRVERAALGETPERGWGGHRASRRGADHERMVCNRAFHADVDNGRCNYTVVKMARVSNSATCGHSLYRNAAHPVREPPAPSHRDRDHTVAIHGHQTSPFQRSQTTAGHARRQSQRACFRWGQSHRVALHQTQQVPDYQRHSQCTTWQPLLPCCSQAGIGPLEKQFARLVSRRLRSWWWTEGFRILPRQLQSLYVKRIEGGHYI